MATALDKAFCSKRLVYTAIDDTDETQTWFHEQIKTDPVGFALGDSNILRPQTKERSDEILGDIRKAMLGVLICLAPEGENKQKGSDTAGPMEKTKPTPIGVLSIVIDDENGSGYRHHHRLCVMSISIAPAYRNSGYGGEAINWALDWVFTRANMHALSLACVEFNERGRHLYEKLGFVPEGRFRKCHWHERKWWDVLLYSMLEEEWLALRGGQGREELSLDT